MTESTPTDLESHINLRLANQHRSAILLIVRELGTEHSLEQILNELSTEDRKYIMSLRPIDLVDAPSSGANGHASGAPAFSVPPPMATAPDARPSRKKVPKRPLTAKKTSAKKTAAKKPPKKPPGAKKAAAKSATKPSTATAAPKPTSEKARVTELVAAQVSKLGKGSRFKTGDMLTALGTDTKDTAKRVKVVAALKALETSGAIRHEGDGRASVYVVT